MTPAASLNNDHCTDMSLPYNGYSWKQRAAISAARHIIEASSDTSILAYLNSGKPCELCSDPNPPPSSWHSEDYSLPYTWAPPATLIVCKACHSRLHKRFKQPWDWRLYLIHLRAGGYGYEFTKLNTIKQRRARMDSLAAGENVELPIMRERHLTGQEWWQGITLDPESLEAAWARPRPYRARPNTEVYRAALNAAEPTEQEMALLKYHADQPRRCATMRQLASTALKTDRPGTANLLYGSLAHRLVEHLSWTPDTREDGSPIWMSVVAEGWQPKDREFEWVMIESLAKAL